MSLKILLLFPLFTLAIPMQDPIVIKKKGVEVIKSGHRYFPSGHFPSDRKTTFPIRRPFPSAPLSIRTAFHPCHFPSVPLSIRATFHPFGSYIKKDGKFYRWKVARMGSGTDGKWYRWKVSSMENDVWKGSSDGKCRRMGNVPMGNSGDPFLHLILSEFFRIFRNFRN